MVSRKLKPYFQAHQIKVLITKPQRKQIESRSHSSRMTKWEDQLADFGLEYEPRKALKAQALANFITKCTTRPGPKTPSKIVGSCKWTNHPPRQGAEPN